MKSAVVAACLLLGAAFGACAAGAQNWSVVEQTPGSKGACLARSADRSVNDGYQTVRAHIVVGRDKVVVESPSDLDAGFSDIGLRLRKREFLRIDRVAGKKRAVFESGYAAIVQGFKAGREVEVDLRFWPEFPVTGVHSVRFSLMGFTKAYQAAVTCK